LVVFARSDPDNKLRKEFISRRSSRLRILNDRFQVNHSASFLDEKPRLSLILCSQCRCSYQNIRDASFAATVVLLVQVANRSTSIPAMSYSAAEKTFPRGQDIFAKMMRASLPQVRRDFGVGSLPRISALRWFGPKMSTTPGALSGKADQGIVFILLSHRLGWHEENFMGIDATRHMSLGSTDDNAIDRRSTTRVKIWICLFTGWKRSILSDRSFSHTMTCYPERIKYFKSFEVVRLVFLIDIVSGHVGGIQSIESHASLKARTCLVADQPEHLNFFDQIIHTLVDMSESVDLPAGEMRGGCHQVLMFRTKGELIGESRGVDVRTKTGMLCNILYTFPIVVDDMVKVFKALDIIFFGDNCFIVFSS
jgi:hypothetical protein